jgi:hypothetical protein
MIIKCNWHTLDPFKNKCLGEATRFFECQGLNECAARDIWLMPLCEECAKFMGSIPEMVEISREEYLAYGIMMV